MEMNKLEKYFFEEPKECVVMKWHHYLKIYENHFKRFQGKNPTILEVGVSEGGSLEMWNHYFDGECFIYGIDKNKACKSVPKKLGANNMKIFIGSQEDRVFWSKFKKKTPKFDILIDDGGHRPEHQITTFEEMYERVKDNGVYLCEDLQTSYWQEFGGALNKENTFVEYSKRFVDDINAYHVREGRDLNFRKTTASIHYYDSILVLEKCLDHEVPEGTKRGPGLQYCYGDYGRPVEAKGIS